MRLINADALIDSFTPREERYDCDVWQDMITRRNIVKRIQNFPTAQPPNDDWEKYSDRLWEKAYERGKADARKTGRWINPRAESEMCSCCGCRFYISALFAVGGNDEPQYCPNCGAKMEEVKND